MLGDTKFEFQFRAEEYGGKSIEALNAADIERLLTTEQTAVDVRQGDGLLLPQVDGRQCEIIRPRVRVMEPSLKPTEDAYLDVKFGVVLSVPSDKFIPQITTEDGGSHRSKPTFGVDKPRSVDDVIEDDADDGEDVETKSVLNPDGPITEVPVDAEDEQTTNDDDTQ